MDSGERMIIYGLIAIVLLFLISKLFSNKNAVSTGTASATTSNTETSTSTATTPQTVTALQVTNPAGATVYALSNNVFASVVPATTITYGTYLYFTNTSKRNMKSVSGTLSVTYYQTSQGWVASPDVTLVNILKH